MTAADVTPTTLEHIKAGNIHKALNPNQGIQGYAGFVATFMAGLTVTNDVSARDVQLPKTQFYESKSYPTFTPTGPALVLLVGSGLLLQSFRALRNVDPGYDTADIYTFQFAPEQPRLADGPAWGRFHLDFMDRLRALPGGSAGPGSTGGGAASARIARL